MAINLAILIQIDKIFKDDASEEKGERARMVSVHRGFRVFSRFALLFKSDSLLFAL